MACGWDTSALNNCNPDDEATMTLDVYTNPDFPVGAGVILCAADLPVTVAVVSAPVQLPGMLHHFIKFVGKAMDMVMLDVRISAWIERTHTRTTLVQEEQNGRSSENTPEGDSDEPV